jgi:hypothetical protein
LECDSVHGNPIVEADDILNAYPGLQKDQETSKIGRN